MPRRHRIVFDETVLSNFAVAGAFHLLKSLYPHDAYVTTYVVDEAFRGVQHGYHHLNEVIGACETGWPRLVVLDKPAEVRLFRLLAVSLGFGEASSIAFAKIRGGVFASDDRAARDEAKTLGVSLTGTAGLLAALVRRKILDSKEADKLLREMVQNGFYSPVESSRELL